MPKKSIKSNKNKRILIGITGGIAVYKICSLINIFKKEGCEIKVIMTEAAIKFVTPLTFQTLTNSPVYSDMFKITNKTDVEHIILADWCDIFVLAPATANTIGKVSMGIADNLLTSVVMALPEKTPVIIAPTMNVHMWKNPILQKNIGNLKRHKNKYIFVNPQKGMLACGYEGEGKIAELEKIVRAIKKVLKQ